MTRHFVLDGNAITAINCTMPNMHQVLQETRSDTGIYGIGLGYVDRDAIKVGIKVGDNIAWPTLTTFVEALSKKLDPKEKRGPLRISTA